MFNTLTDFHNDVIFLMLITHVLNPVSKSFFWTGSLSSSRNPVFIFRMLHTRLNDTNDLIIDLWFKHLFKSNMDTSFMHNHACKVSLIDSFTNQYGDPKTR